MPRLSPWLMTPALVAASWLLSAQSPATDQLAALEKRVAELEARIQKTGELTQIKAPFQVLAANGKPILMVAEGTPKTGAVLITQTAKGGEIYALDLAGNLQAGLRVVKEGQGVVYAQNPAGKVGAVMNGNGGIEVWNLEGVNVANMAVTKEGKGRLSIWNRQVKVAALEDSGSGGSLSVMNSSGQLVASLAGSGGSGALRVMGSEGKVGAALIGEKDGGGLLGLATRTGQTFAQGGISSDGRGLFQVFAPGGTAIAVMGQGGPGNAGIFQIANAGGVKASLTTAEGGGGMFQLVSTQGQVTVEAGSLPSGKGLVRVGPFWKCSPIKPSTPVMSVGHEDCLVGSTDAK